MDERELWIVVAKIIYGAAPGTDGPEQGWWWDVTVYRDNVIVNECDHEGHRTCKAALDCAENQMQELLKDAAVAS